MPTSTIRRRGEKRDITVYANPEDYASFPQLARTDNELVLLFQVQNLEKLRASGQHPHYQPAAVPRWTTSRDGGLTWTLHETAPTLGSVRDISYGSAPLADGGTVTLTYSDQSSLRAIIQHGRIGYRPYQDESASGAAADIRLISDLGPFRHFYPHGTTRTGGGEIIVAGYAPLGPSPSGAPDARTTAVFLCSGDEGRTWHYLSHLPNPFRFSLEEPAVLEVAPGRLITLLRTGWDPVPVEQRPAEARTGYGYFLYQSASRDGGRSWTKPVPLPLWGHPPHLTRLASGNILLVYGHRRPPYEIRAVLSRDHGRSWDLDTLRTVRTFAPGDYDIGYPVATQLADGAIVCAYYGYASPEIGEKMPHGIFVNVFDEQWLAACRT